MTNVDWVGRVSDALKNLDEDFEENELAYLALTSKVEKPVIDRLAFRLHRDYGTDCIAVAREFTVRNEIQRVDLAIVSGRVPHLLLEAKAMHALNAYSLSEKQRYPRYVCDDIKKLERYQPDNASHKPKKIALLLTTYSHNPPKVCWDGVVKYARLIRSCHLNGLDDLERKLDEHFPPKSYRVLACGNVPGGRAFDIDVTVNFRLFDAD